MSCPNAKCYALPSFVKMTTNTYSASIQYRCCNCHHISYQCLSCANSNTIRYYASVKFLDKHIFNYHNDNVDLEDNNNMYVENACSSSRNWLVMCN